MFALQWRTRFSPFAQNLISNFYFKPTRHLFHWKKRLCFTWAFLSSWSLHSSAVSRPYPGPKQIISNVHKYCMRSSARLVPANNKGMHTTFSWWNTDTWSGASSVGGAGRPGSHKLGRWAQGQAGCLGGRGRHLSLSCFWATLASAAWQPSALLHTWSGHGIYSHTVPYSMYSSSWIRHTSLCSRVLLSISTSKNRHKGGRDSWAQLKKWRHHHIFHCILK